MTSESSASPLPVERFMEALHVERMEDRFEFAQWTGRAGAEVQCTTAGAGASTCQARAYVEAEYNPEWGEEVE